MSSLLRRDAYVFVEFTCQRRNGSSAVVPQGACVVEEGPHFAAICWVALGHSGRAEISTSDLRSHVEAGRLTYAAPWHKQA